MMNSGIYKITNIVNNKFYIGSAVNIIQRKNVHFSMLNRNCHKNSHLQASYNKYGKENFKHEILAFCPKEYLLKLEQWFIDTQKPNYNMLLIAGNRLGHINSKESKIKSSILMKSYWEKVKENPKEFDTRKKSLENNRLKATIASSEKRKLKVKLIYPDNKEHYFNSIKEASIFAKCSFGALQKKLKNNNIIKVQSKVLFNFKIEYV